MEMGGAVLNLGRRFVELTLPLAKKYNPFRVEIVPSEHTRPFSPTRGGKGQFVFLLRNPWRVCAAMGRGVLPGHRDPM